MTDYDGWNRVDDGQREACINCKEVNNDAPCRDINPCPYMQKLAVLPAQIAGSLFKPLPVPSGYVARDEVIPLAVRLIEEKAK